MEIKSVKNSPNFGIQIKTTSILEATTQRIIYNSGIDGFKEVYFAFCKRKFPGHPGFARQTRPMAEKILTKYPEIAKATSEINEIVKNNPNISKNELALRTKPIIERLGENIDIEI